MAACTKCGSRSRSGADFCSSCGTALGSDSGRAAESVEMLSEVSDAGRPASTGSLGAVSGGSVAADTKIETGSRGRRLLGVGGIVLALVFGWSMMSGGSEASEAVADRTQEDGSDRGEDLEDESSATVPSSRSDEPDQPKADEDDVRAETTTRVVGGIEECVVVGVEESEIDESQGEDLSRDAPEGENLSDDVPRSDFDAVEDTESEGCEIATAYQLVDPDGELADDALVAALPPLIVVAERNLDQINVGSGTVERVSLSVTSVMLRTRTHLVLHTADGVFAVRIDDLGGEPILLTDDRDTEVIPGPDPSTAWIGEFGETTFLFHLTNLDTGEVLQTLDQEQAQASLDPFGGGIVNEIGSGAYQETPDGYRRFSEGWAVVSSDELVLMRRCNEIRTCENVWLDRLDGSELGYPEPDLGQLFYWGWVLSDGGQWLHRLQEDAGNLHEVLTGRVVELGFVRNSSAAGEFQSAVQISTDGRWAAYPDNFGTGVTVVDLRTEVAYSIGTDSHVSQVFFSPLP